MRLISLRYSKINKIYKIRSYYHCSFSGLFSLVCHSIQIDTDFIILQHVCSVNLDALDPTSLTFIHSILNIFYYPILKVRYIFYLIPLIKLFRQVIVSRRIGSQTLKMIKIFLPLLGLVIPDQIFLDVLYHFY